MERPVSVDSADAFRAAMRRHAAGVCIVSVGTGEAANGMAVSSASSFSMDPPAVLFCANLSASLTPRLHNGQPFGLTLLSRHHEAVARAFSRGPSGRARFDVGPWVVGDDAVPWLEDAPANVAARVASTLTYGTHIAVIGRVERVRLGADAPSLLFRDGAFS